MLVLTPHGSNTFLSSITRRMKTIHLHTRTGELKGYGYEYKHINVDSDGVVSEAEWTLVKSADEEQVVGYFVADDAGAVLFSEEFDAPMSVGNKITEIGVRIRLGMLFNSSQVVAETEH